MGTREGGVGPREGTGDCSAGVSAASGEVRPDAPRGAPGGAVSASPRGFPEVSIRAWLSSIGLEHHAGAFERAGLEPESLPLLTEADLAALGVPTLGARRRIALRAREDVARKGRRAVCLERHVVIECEVFERSAGGARVMRVEGAKEEGRDARESAGAATAGREFRSPFRPEEGPPRSVAWASTVACQTRVSAGTVSALLERGKRDRIAGGAEDEEAMRPGATAGGGERAEKRALFPPASGGSRAVGRPPEGGAASPAALPSISVSSDSEVWGDDDESDGAVDRATKNLEKKGALEEGPETPHLARAHETGGARKETTRTSESGRAQLLANRGKRHDGDDSDDGVDDIIEICDEKGGATADVRGELSPAPARGGPSADGTPFSASPAFLPRSPPKPVHPFFAPRGTRAGAASADKGTRGEERPPGSKKVPVGDDRWALGPGLGAARGGVASTSASAAVLDGCFEAVAAAVRSGDGRDASGSRKSPFSPAPSARHKPSSSPVPSSPLSFSLGGRPAPSLPLPPPIDLPALPPPVPPAASARRASRAAPLPLFPWQLVPGLPSFVVDRFDRLPPDPLGLRAHWVLTHFHADHYKGLTKTFDRGVIFCTPETARLVEFKFKVDPARIVQVPFYTPVRLWAPARLGELGKGSSASWSAQDWPELQAPGALSGATSQTASVPVTLTFLPANHCPGAAMVLFSVPDMERSHSPQATGQRLASGEGNGEVVPPEMGTMEGGGGSAPAPPLSALCSLPVRPHVLHTGDCRLDPGRIGGCPVLSELARRAATFAAFAATCATLAPDPEPSSLAPRPRPSVSHPPPPPLAHLVLDTTYCDPAYDFPPQDDVIAFVRQAASAESHHPRTLFLFGTYTIGKERVFLEAAKTLRRPVCVSEDKMEILRRLDLSEEDRALLTTDERSTNLHAAPMWRLGRDAVRALLKQSAGRFTKAVVFRPTGWSHEGGDQGGTPAKGAKTSRKEAASRQTTLAAAPPVASGASASSSGASHSPAPSLALCTSRTERIGTKHGKGAIVTYSVPYSEHSSYRELCGFVRWIAPQTVLPAVNADRGGPKTQLLLQRLQADEGVPFPNVLDDRA